MWPSLSGRTGRSQKMDFSRKCSGIHPRRKIEISAHYFSMPCCVEPDLLPSAVDVHKHLPTAPARMEPRRFWPLRSAAARFNQTGSHAAGGRAKMLPCRLSWLQMCCFVTQCWFVSVCVRVMQIWTSWIQKHKSSGKPEKTKELHFLRL